jgi:phosphohistidine phosphatase
VLLVGHQPTLGHLASLLLAGAEADWSIKKGAIWWFSKRSREGRDQTVLRAVINPEMLR